VQVDVRKIPGQYPKAAKIAGALQARACPVQLLPPDFSDPVNMIIRPIYEKDGEM
jgi:hypothetical protein